MTAAHELKLVVVLLRDIYRFFAVELLGYHKQFLTAVLLLFLLAHKRYELTPARIVVGLLVLAVQFINILLA